MSVLALVAVLLGAAVVVGLAIAFLMWPSARRSRAIKGFASTHGLSYMGDTWVLGDCDFALFQKGRDRRWSNVVSGAWNGTTVVYADYEFTEDGQNPQQTYAFSAVVTDLGCRVPQVDVTARSVAGGLAEELGVHGIELASEELNDRYVVEAEDDAFARDLIDGRMAAVLLAAPPDLHVQFGPQRMVVWGHRRLPADLAGILDAASALDQRVPVIVQQDAVAAGSEAARPAV